MWCLTSPLTVGDKIDMQTEIANKAKSNMKAAEKTRKELTGKKAQAEQDLIEISGDARQAHLHKSKRQEIRGLDKLIRREEKKHNVFEAQYQKAKGKAEFLNTNALERMGQAPEAIETPAVLPHQAVAKEKARQEIEAGKSNVATENLPTEAELHEGWASIHTPVQEAERE